MCSVFAESEVINLVNEGVELERIARGIHASLAGRVMTLALRVGMEPEVVVTGGVAKSGAVLAALGERLGVELHPLPNGFDPQLVGALGAAALAADEGDER